MNFLMHIDAWLNVLLLKSWLPTHQLILEECDNQGQLQDNIDLINLSMYKYGYFSN